MYISSELVSTAAVRFREQELLRTLERTRMIGERIEEERIAAAAVGAAPGTRSESQIVWRPSLLARALHGIGIAARRVGGAVGVVGGARAHERGGHAGRVHGTNGSVGAVAHR